jgi:hypothetical protein
MPWGSEALGFGIWDLGFGVWVAELAQDVVWEHDQTSERIGVGDKGGVGRVGEAQFGNGLPAFIARRRRSVPEAGYIDLAHLSGINCCQEDTQAQNTGSLACTHSQERTDGHGRDTHRKEEKKSNVEHLEFSARANVCKHLTISAFPARYRFSSPFLP